MEDAENEGMSTGKKVAAGAALGVAVPAAAAVARKLLSDGGDDMVQAGRVAAFERHTGLYLEHGGVAGAAVLKRVLGDQVEALPKPLYPREGDRDGSGARDVRVALVAGGQ